MPFDQAAAIARNIALFEKLAVLRQTGTRFCNGKAAGLGDVTVPRLEAKNGDLGGRPATGEKIIAALKKAGVEFLDDGQGVRLEPQKLREKKGK